MNEKDNIHEAFSQQFDPKNIQNQGWNEPSDSVWDKIIIDLDEKKKPIRYWPYLVLACLLFSLMASGLLYNKNQKLTNKVEAIQSELESYGETSGMQKDNSSLKIKKSTTTNLTPSVEDRSTFKNDLLNNQNIAVDIKVKKNSLATAPFAQNNNYKNFTESAIKNEASQIHNLQKTNAISEQIVSAANSKKDNSERKAVLATTNRGELFIDQITTKEGKVINTNHLELFLSPTIDPIKPATKKKHSIRMRTGLIASNLINSGTQESALSELIDLEYAKAGLNLDLIYTNAISSRLSIDAGLGINSQEFITEYDIILPYNTGQEVLENGVGYIDFEHSLPTSFGNTATELRLVRTRANTPLEESDVNIDFNTNHKIVALRLPVGINYHFSEDHNGLSIGVSGVPTYIISAQSGISSVISQHSEISSENNSSTSEYQSLRKLNLALGVNLGYSLPISEKGGIDIVLGYQMNVLSHFETSNFSSKIQGLNLSAGYSYKF